MVYANSALSRPSAPPPTRYAFMMICRPRYSATSRNWCPHRVPRQQCCMPTRPRRAHTQVRSSTPSAHRAHTTHHICTVHDRISRGIDLRDTDGRCTRPGGPQREGLHLHLYIYGRITTVVLHLRPPATAHTHRPSATPRRWYTNTPRMAGRSTTRLQVHYRSPNQRSLSGSRI